MTEYDNTNRGVLFQAHENQRLIGQGKINIDGSEHQYVCVQQPISRDGVPQMVLYVRAGVLFTNDKRTSENAPAYSGPLDFHPTKRVAAWIKEKDGRNYMSLSVSDKQQSEASSAAASNPLSAADASAFDDDIPF